MNGATSNPMIPAVIVYAAISMLNCAAEIESCRISIGPSGIMIMKSMMCVNCTAASRISSDRSER